MRNAQRVLLGLMLGPSLLLAQRLTVSKDPTLRLGAASDTVSFGDGLVGAIRLPDHSILVADRSEYSLRVFSEAGRPIRVLGRSGSGPGEFGHVARLWRCGDEIVAYDLDNGARATVLAGDLSIKRSFRFRPPPGAGASPYRSACNGQTFAHVGWPSGPPTPGASRQPSIVWISGVDSTSRVIGQVLGSERWVSVAGGTMSSRPMPLGRQPLIAVGPRHIYVGSADRYEIEVYDLTGKRLTSITGKTPDLRRTQADIDAAFAEESAGLSEAATAKLRLSYDQIRFPETIPAYSALLVDAAGLLWVRDYRKGRDGLSRWSVFSPDGRLQGEVQLPAALTVSEIGTDYVLGTYVDPDTSVPEVRSYRLTGRRR